MTTEFLFKCIIEVNPGRGALGTGRTISSIIDQSIQLNKVRNL